MPELKALLGEGVIGEVVSVQHLEPVGHWHYRLVFLAERARKEGRVVEAEGGPEGKPQLEAGGLAERAGFEPARQV